MLHIRTEQADLTVNAQGASAGMLTLGVIGPSATIAIGHYAGLPVWAIVVISVLQLVAFIARRARSEPVRRGAVSHSPLPDRVFHCAPGQLLRRSTLL